MKFTHFNLITELLDSFLVCLTTGSFGVCLINENSIISTKLKKNLHFLGAYRSGEYILT